MRSRYRAQGFWPIYPVRGAPPSSRTQLMYSPASPHMQGAETAARGGAPKEIANGALPIDMEILCIGRGQVGVAYIAY